MTESDRHLDELFSKYRAAFPEVAESPDFIPRMWARIESRRSFPLVFQRLARILVTASAAACLLLAALNLAPHPDSSTTRSHYATYTDALSAETSLDKTYYSESSRPAESFPVDFRQ